MMGKFAELFEKTLDKLGLAVSYAWPKVVTSYYYEILATVCMAMLMAVVCGIVSYRLTTRVVKQESANDEYGPVPSSIPMSIVAAVTGILSLISIVILMVHAPTVIALISSPEGTYIRMILGK